MAKDETKKLKEEKKVEKMGFDAKVVPHVLQGKTKTYRVRDHNLKRGDKVEFENSQTVKIFGNAIITKVEKTTVKKIDLKDPAHGATYNNVDELIAAFKRHKPAVEVNPNTEVFVYTYKFTPSKKEVAKPEKETKVEKIKIIDPWQTLKWAKLTEKALASVERENKLIFIVRSGAKKSDIKAAVEKVFDVKVDKVNMLIDTKGQKKAFVRLKPEFSALDIATKLGMM